jgi:hypothetical protein
VFSSRVDATFSVSGTHTPAIHGRPYAYHAIDPIKESLLNAGFNNIEIAVLPFRQTVPNIATFARGTVEVRAPRFLPLPVRGDPPSYALNPIAEIIPV